jgi:hypothetical protein
MTQFKLSGKDIPHIADLLAAGAGKAQGEVSDLAMALNQTGLVAEPDRPLDRRDHRRPRGVRLRGPDRLRRRHLVQDDAAAPDPDVQPRPQS